ncbi:hypothetical protein T02_10754 [Trichinella nativa]|uniref:Uncharacterized protein n=2 Tax=Trichinella TaxID=6333 RepID=A0A0V1LB75_9BILA|nr:hypothetical protein T02_10754 [Trichinella nativa]
MKTRRGAWINNRGSRLVDKCSLIAREALLSLSNHNGRLAKTFHCRIGFPRVSADDEPREESLAARMFARDRPAPGRRFAPRIQTLDRWAISASPRYYKQMRIQPSVLFQQVGWMKLKKKRFNNDHIIISHCIAVAAVRRNNKQETAVGWNAPPALPSPQLGKMPVIYHCRVACRFEDNEQKPPNERKRSGRVHQYINCVYLPSLLFANAEDPTVGLIVESSSDGGRSLWANSEARSPAPGNRIRPENTQICRNYGRP